jgi:hypothetical protein
MHGGAKIRYVVVSAGSSPMRMDRRLRLFHRTSFNLSLLGAMHAGAGGRGCRHNSTQGVCRRILSSSRRPIQ